MEIRKKYNNNIEVSNLGNIKRNGKISKQTESHGYNYIKIDGKKIGVHRLVACCFLGLNILDKKLLVCHKNDIRNDNRIENLFIGTSYDNVHDMINKGRNIRKVLFGSNASQSKLNEIHILIIRYYYRIGIKVRDIANYYNMGLRTIYDIINRNTRTHV